MVGQPLRSLPLIVAEVMKMKGPNKGPGDRLGAGGGGSWENERDNLIEGAVSLLESADMSLLQRVGGLKGRARGRLWLPGKRRGAASGLAAGALRSLPAERGPGRPLGFGAPLDMGAFMHDEAGETLASAGPAPGPWSWCRTQRRKEPWAPGQ